MCVIHSKDVSCKKIFIPVISFYLYSLGQTFLILNSNENTAIMNAIQSYVLKKNDYEESTKSIFKSLWTDEEFKDVTLASNDHQEIRGHKAILGASSSFFRNIFKNKTAANLVLYLKGVSSKDLGSIMEFIYCGEANVSKADLASFLDVAKELEIEGLMGPKTSAPDNPSDIFSDDGLSTITDTEDEGNNKSEVFVKMETASDSISSESGENLETESLITSHSIPFETSEKSKSAKIEIKPFNAADVSADGIECEAEPKKYQCTHCEFCTAHKRSLPRHLSLVHGLDLKHEATNTKEGEYSCYSCDFKTMHKRSLKRHTETLHAEKVESSS